MNDEVFLTSKKICEHIQHFFPRLPKTQYWLLIVNNQFDCEYDWFLNSKHKYAQERSHPIFILTNYQLAYLEEIVNQVSTTFHLTIKYRNFSDLRWPESQKRIQYLD